MNRLLMILTPPVAVLVGLLLLGGDPAAAGPEGPAAASPEALAPAIAPAPAPATTNAPAGADLTAAVIPATSRPENDPFARADELLGLVRDWIASGVEGSPGDVVLDMTQLIERHPEAAAHLLAALEGADRRTWLIVGHAFARLNDPARQVELVRAHRALDPWIPRFRAATADSASLIAALREPADPGFRIRVLDGVPDALLQDPDVRGLLVEIANRDESEAARGRAILRLARDSAPESTALLLRVVEDEGRAASDRQSAAMGLSRNRSPEVGALWRRVLERRDSIPILLHAVRGLGAHLTEPGVTNALLGELTTGTNPANLRGAAVTTLARGIGQLEDSERDAVLERIRGVATDLERTGGAPRLLAQIRDRFGRHWKGSVAAVEVAAALSSE